MNLLDELKEVVEIRINEKALADKIYDLAVDKLMLKLVDIIPTEFDNVLYESKKAELKELFAELLAEGVDKLEEITGVELDGEE